MTLPKFPTASGPTDFLDAYSAWTHPLKVEHAQCYWRFAVDGDAEAHTRVQQIEERLSDLHAEVDVFEAHAASLEASLQASAAPEEKAEGEIEELEWVQNLHKLPALKAALVKALDP